MWLVISWLDGYRLSSEMPMTGANITVRGAGKKGRGGASMHYNARVMIVDRTGADSKLVAAVQSQGFDAITAGLAGLSPDQVSDADPDLVVIDNQDDIANGLDLTRAQSVAEDRRRADGFDQQRYVGGKSSEQYRCRRR
jgi:hypothetical protein